MMASAILSDSIPCDRLQIDRDQPDPSAESKASQPSDSSSVAQAVDGEPESIAIVR